MANKKSKKQRDEERYRAWWADPKRTGEMHVQGHWNNTWKQYGGMNADQVSVVERYHKQANARLGVSFNNNMPNGGGIKAAAKVPKKVSWGSAGVWAGIDTYMNMKNGDSFGTAAMKGAASGIMWATMPGIMTAHMLATTLPAGINAVNQFKRSRESWWYKQHLPNFGGNYQDTARAQTMRQAAVEAIQGSKMNARSALGGEARILSQAMYRG